MRTACLRIASICLHLHRVDQVRELDRVLDEEDWDIVAHQIPIALLGIEFDRDAAHIARHIDRASAARDGRKAGEYRNLGARALEQVRFRDAGQRFIQLEIAVGRRAARMDDSFRNPLMVEMEDLLSEFLATRLLHSLQHWIRRRRFPVHGKPSAHSGAVP